MEQIKYFSCGDYGAANFFLRELQEKKIEYRLEFPGNQYGFDIVIIYKLKEDA